MTNFPFSATYGVGTHVLQLTDLNVLVDTSGGAVNLILPNISVLMDFVAKQGYSVGSIGFFPINITDISNNASVNNITIYSGGSDKFSENLTSVVINKNNGSASFKPTSNNSWNINTGGGSSGYVIAQNQGTPLTQQPVIDFVGAGVTATNGAGKTTVTIAGGGNGDTVENGAFTLLADGTVATINNGSSFAPNINFSISVRCFQPSIGDTITNTDTGGTGIIISQGHPLTNSFTLGSVRGIWSNNANITYIGATNNPTVGGLTFILTIPTINKLKLLNDIKVYNTGDISTGSFNGVSDGISQSCVYTINSRFGTTVNIDLTNCIFVSGQFPQGWTGLITAIRDTEYDITLTQLTTGLDITGQWMAQTK
jgi:hypothetical protein